MEDHSASLRVLRRDPHFVPLIKKYGPPVLVARGEWRPLPIFDALIRSIIYQQLSGKAAATILERFKNLYKDAKGRSRFPKPAELMATPIEDLRSVGLSSQKAAYLHDLARRFVDNTIKHRKLPSMTTDEIIEHLVQIHGVGVWTVQMILIFTLGRLDILPVGDLGIRKGFQKVYRLRDLPTPKKMEQLAKPWREHASVASWYLWRVADER